MLESEAKCIWIFLEIVFFSLYVLRLGAFHRALALLPVMAATGSWSPSPSASEDRRSSKAEARCQRHLSSAR